MDKQSKCSEKGGGRNSSGNPFSEDEEMGYDEEDEEDDEEGQADSGKGPSVFGGSSTCGRTAGSGAPPDTHHRTPILAGNTTSVGGAIVKPTAASG